MQYHPDRQGGSEEMFCKVTFAYKMLTDPSYRAANQKKPPKDLTQLLRIIVDFEEAFFGTTVCISYNRVTVSDALVPVKSQPVEVLVVTVEVPPGTQHLQARFPGHGLKCGDHVGDALCLVEVSPHREFRLDGANVRSRHEVTLNTMIRGGDTVVNTMWGQRTVRIRPASMPGQQYKIPKCGVNQEHFHIIEIFPVYPNEGELKTKNWSGLNINWDDKPKDDGGEDMLKKYENIKKG